MTSTRPRASCSGRWRSTPANDANQRVAKSQVTRHTRRYDHHCQKFELYSDTSDVPRRGSIRPDTGSADGAFVNVPAEGRQSAVRVPLTRFPTLVTEGHVHPGIPLRLVPEPCRQEVPRSVRRDKRNHLLLSPVSLRMVGAEHARYVWQQSREQLAGPARVARLPGPAGVASAGFQCFWVVGAEHRLNVGQQNPEWLEGHTGQRGAVAEQSVLNLEIAGGGVCRAGFLVVEIAARHPRVRIRADGQPCLGHRGQ